MAETLRERMTGLLAAIERLPGGVAARHIREILRGGRFDLSAGGERLRITCTDETVRIDSVTGLEPPIVTITERGIEAMKDGASVVDLAASGAIDYRGPLAASAAQYHADLARIDAAVRAVRIAASALSSDSAASRAVPPPASPRPPVVTIVGAGVTGLTAAHELIERGFRVQVVERLRDPGHAGACRVGGVAATQVCRLPPSIEGRVVASERPSWIPWGLEIGVDLVFDAATGKRELRCAFDPALRDHVRVLVDEGPPRALTNAERLTRIARAILDAAAREATRSEEPLRVLARARYEGTDPLVAEGASRAAGIAAKEVLGALAIEAGADGLPEGAIEVVPTVAERPSPDAAPRRARPRTCRVELVVDERRAPGEHGYRFFPSYFHNLFDTMRRIPIPSTDGNGHGRTVFDHLVRTRKLTFAVGRELLSVPRERSRSFHALRELLRTMGRAMGASVRDVALFELRLLRYLTSSPARRGELEARSWAAYIGLDDFSPSFRRFLEEAPLALAGARASETDARTNANLTFQHLMEQLTGGERVDLTLDAPTSEAWFDPWKAHLRRQGVRFWNGTLERLDIDDAGHVQPVFSPRVHPPYALVERPGPRSLSEESQPSTRLTGHAPSAESSESGESGESGDVLLPADYCLLALPLEACWEVFDTSGFTDRAPTEHADVRALLDWRRAVRAEGGETDPGHCCDPAPGRALPAGPFRTFSGVQLYFTTGVRIGEGHLWFPESPWALTAIAQPQLWRVPRSLERDGYLGLLSIDIGDFYGPYRADPDGVVPPVPLALSAEGIARETWRQLLASLPPLPHGAQHPQPAWFHLDRYLHLSVAPSEAPPSNAAPYLVCRPEDWARRPGSAGGRSAPIAYATEGGLVCAGPHMRTAARLTMTESANESARRAVNAILDDVAARTKLHIAEPCRVWSIEEEELDDLAPLKALDAVLHARGLPHFADTLGLETLADAVDPLAALERFADPSSTTDPLAALRALLPTELGESSRTAAWVIDPLAALRDLVQSLLRSS